MKQILGAGDYGVTVSEWSGRIVWQSATTGLHKIEWGRERNEMSKAKIVGVVPQPIAQRLEPWVHLLSIYRDGDLVWHGVITRVATTWQQVTIDAADGSVFFSRRRVASNRTWQQHDATQVMRTMVEDAVGFADSTGLVESIATRESRIWVTAGWTAAESMLDDVVDNLVKQGLVWTVAAGRLLIGPLAATHTTAQISDADFDGSVSVVKDGSEVTTDALVKGKGVWGQYVDQSTPVGLLQSIEKADGAVRAEECEQTAMRLVKDSMVTPRRLVMPSSARLLPDAPVTVAELVPGVQVPVSSRQTGVIVAATMEIKDVSVSADDSGEDIKVTLTETSITGAVPDLPDPADIDMRSPYEKELASKQNTRTGSGQATEENQQEVGVPPS